MPTLEEVEEALRHLAAVPADERGKGWHSYCDALLEQRKQLAGARDTAVVFSGAAS